jgi:hypothetical protein
MSPYPLEVMNPGRSLCILLHGQYTFLSFFSKNPNRKLDSWEYEFDVLCVGFPFLSGAIFRKIDVQRLILLCQLL